VTNNILGVKDFLMTIDNIVNKDHQDAFRQRFPEFDFMGGDFHEDGFIVSGETETDIDRKDTRFSYSALEPKAIKNDFSPLIQRAYNANDKGDPLKINEHFCKVAALNRQIVLDWKAKLGASRRDCKGK
jgi:hypothetical protein